MFDILQYRYDDFADDTDHEALERGMSAAFGQTESGRNVAWFRRLKDLVRGAGGTSHPPILH